MKHVHQKIVLLVTIGIFLGKGFKFQPNFCHGCHDILTMNINLSDIDILNIKSADYCCIISGISINEAINVMQNADFT